MSVCSTTRRIGSRIVTFGHPTRQPSSVEEESKWSSVDIRILSTCLNRRFHVNKKTSILPPRAFMDLQENKYCLYRRFCTQVLPQSALLYPLEEKYCLCRRVCTFGNFQATLLRFEEDLQGSCTTHGKTLYNCEKYIARIIGLCKRNKLRVHESCSKK